MKIGTILSVKKSTTTHAAIPSAASQSITIIEEKTSPTPPPAPKVVEFTEEDFKKTPPPTPSNVVDYAGIPEADAVITAPAVVTPIQAKKQRKAQVKTAKPKATTKKATTKAEKPKVEKEPIERPSTFNIVDYSEKSIALFGDTKPIKSKLISIGGRFNPSLRPWGGDTRVPGWIFPIKARTELQELLAAI